MKKSTYYLLPTTYSRKGFTVIELLIFSAIFAVVSIAFVAILLTITRVQLRETSIAEVSQESQFLLQSIQRYIENSSLIEMPADVPTSTLKLRMPSLANDPTYVYLSSSTVYVKETNGGAAVPLTSSRVLVSSMSFTKRENAAGHDSVAVSFIVEYNTSNIQQKASRALTTAIARVSAATFDSDLRASSANAKIGAAAQEWQSINSTIFFSGSNVGIGSGAVSPQQRLEVDGGLRLNTSAAKPACSAVQNTRGTFWVTQSGAGAKDNVEVCVKNASDTYIWAPIY
jgi:Tfp pilus assembly protein PilE